jgi:hypothetical protein
MSAPSGHRVRPALPNAQSDLLTAPTGLPEGFRYHPDVLSLEEEELLARQLGELPFKPSIFTATSPTAKS